VEEMKITVVQLKTLVFQNFSGGNEENHRKSPGANSIPNLIEIRSFVSKSLRMDRHDLPNVPSFDALPEHNA
jgi:hypothetical protein